MGAQFCLGLSLAGVLRLVRQVREIAAPFEIAGHRVSVGVSVGIALAPGDGTDALELLKRADVALYKSEAAGRSGHQFYRVLPGRSGRRMKLQSPKAGFV